MKPDNLWHFGRVRQSLPPTCPTNAGWKVDSITYKKPMVTNQVSWTRDNILVWKIVNIVKQTGRNYWGSRISRSSSRLSSIVQLIMVTTTQRVCIRISRNLLWNSLHTTLPHSNLEDHAHSFYPHSNQSQAVLWLHYQLWFHILENFTNTITVSSRLLKTFKEKMTFLKQLALQGRFFDFFWELSFFFGLMRTTFQGSIYPAHIPNPYPPVLSLSK